MASRETMGVVDANIDVYESQSLKLAGLSIALENEAANTVDTALLVRVKAADIIIRKIGLDRGGKIINGVHGTKINGVDGVR